MTRGSETGKDETGIDESRKGEIGKDKTGKGETGKDKTWNDEIGKDNTGKGEIGKDETGKDKTGKDETGKDQTRGGLCDDCRWVREVLTRRSRFLLCERSQFDPDYPRYPGLPVLQCRGYEERTGNRAEAGRSDR